MQEEVALEAVNPSVKKWMIVSALIGYVVFLFFLFFFVDLGNLFSVLSSINLSIYIIALLCVVAAITFHALVWFELLGSVSIRLGFRRTYVLYWVGVFVDNLIPGYWSGDLFRAYLLSRDPKIDGGKAVASVVAKNVYEAIFNLGSMLLGLSVLLLNYRIAENSIMLAIVGIMILLVLPLMILLAISFKPEAAKRALALLVRFLSKIGGKRWNLSGFQGTMNKILGQYHEGMKILLQNPKMFLKPLILSFLALIFELLTLVLVFASLGRGIPLDKVVIVRSIAGNLEAQGYALAGYAQIVATALYSALGIDIALGVSVALLGGLVVFWLKTVVSYAAFHCTVFTPCHNFVCRAMGVEGYASKKKRCEIEDAT